MRISDWSSDVCSSDLHRRRAFLARREIFLGLQHFGPLEVSDLRRQPFDRRGDHAKRGEEHRVPVARDHLAGDALYGETQLTGDMRLDARVAVGAGADRAGDCAGGDGKSTRLNSRHSFASRIPYSALNYT